MIRDQHHSPVPIAQVNDSQASKVEVSCAAHG